MIKRDGVSLMNTRTKNVSIAKETLDLLNQKKYTTLSGKTVDISKELNAAITGTILYKMPLVMAEYVPITPVLEVTAETTTQASVRLVACGKEVVALNFASARNVGGGFLSGAVAQEEDLCRGSGLYACTKSKPVFYNENILCDDNFYTDNIIYSPQVPFFRDDNNLFIEEPFLVSIISSPAPNLNGIDRKDFESKIQSVLMERAIKILQVAAVHGHKNIVLGAWGCGAFGNDPLQVAEAFKLALTKVPVFEYICFAVYDNKPEQPTLNSFKKVFDK